MNFMQYPLVAVTVDDDEKNHKTLMKNCSIFYMKREKRESKRLTKWLLMHGAY